MTALDRLVVLAIGVMYAAFPLYGTLVALDPLHPPIPLLVGARGAAAIGLTLVATGAVCAWGALRRPAPRRLVAAQLAPGGAIAVAALAGFDPPTGLMLALIVLAFGCVALALYGYAGIPGVLPTVAAWTLGGGCAAALFALLLTLSRRPADLYAYNNGRAVGLFLNSNELAADLLFVLALAAGVAVAGRGVRLRGLAVVTLVIGIAALAATYSRWGFVSALVGLAAYVLVERSRAAWVTLGLAVALAAAVAFGPGGAHHNPRDDTARLVAWSTGIRTFLAFPLTGVGPLAYARTYEALRPPEAPAATTPVAFDPHSLPLAFVAESGLLGGTALMFGWIVYGREILRSLRRRPAGSRRLALAVVAGLVALNVHVLVNTISIYFALAAQGAALALAFAQWGWDAQP